MPRGRKRYYEGELEFDDDPVYSCEVDEDGHIHHWMAFDKKYGPESQAQIDWHQIKGAEGSEEWEVGVPIIPTPKKSKRKKKNDK